MKKFVKLIVFNFLLMNFISMSASMQPAWVDASSNQCVTEIYENNYRPVNFIHPEREIKVEGINPCNDPTPSIVGFYNGDDQAYCKALVEAFPQGKCILTNCETGEIRDVSARQQLEHIIQDAVMQNKILHCLEPKNSLLTPSFAARQSRDLYKTMYTYCGLNLLFGYRTLPSVDEDEKVLTAKINEVRALQYIELKKMRISDFDFQNDRNQFVKNMNYEKNVLFSSTNDFDYSMEKLRDAYTRIKYHVIFDEEIKNANSEKRFYQISICTASAFLAASVYWYSKLSSK